MKADVFFASAGDERGTPQDLFDTLNTEFHFDIDLAASPANAKCPLYFGFGGVADDALEQDWAGMTGFLNPPYSVAGAFVKKAREEADKGCTVVLLLPARTDTKWWHAYIWDKADCGGYWREGVSCRFLPGRLTFELHVPKDLRQTIKDSLYKFDTEDEAARWMTDMVDVTGLPKMAIKGILNDLPDEDLLSSAPFPSCIVIFRKAL